MMTKGRKTKSQTVIGSLLRDERNKAGLTQKAMGDAIGLEYYTMISQMENGYIPIPAGLWVPIGELLHLSTDRWLLLCLNEYMPEVYSALFQNKSRREVACILDRLKAGKLDDNIVEWTMEDEAKISIKEDDPKKKH